MKKIKKAHEIADGITIDKAVRFGKPVIEGTRVPVEVILGKIAGGMEIEEVSREFDITKRDVRNAIKYAAHLVEQEKVHLPT